MVKAVMPLCLSLSCRSQLLLLRLMIVVALVQKPLLLLKRKVGLLGQRNLWQI